MPHLVQSVSSRLAGRPYFLYVADSKLCSRKNLDHIHNQGGRFVCVLPRSRKEDAWFRRRLQTQQPVWLLAMDRSPQREARPTRDVWFATVPPIRSAEGYRIVWVLSLRGAEGDSLARSAAILVLRAIQRKSRSRCAESPIGGAADDGAVSGQAHCGPPGGRAGLIPAASSTTRCSSAVHLP